MIEGLIIQELKQIKDSRGKVMHMLRCDSPLFTKFGEIYFSVVNPGIVKAWKRHFKMTQHFAVPIGKIKLVIYDLREDSPTCRNLQELILGEDNYCLVKIPPLLWYGFKGIDKKPSMIANCTDMPHDPTEVEVNNYLNSHIPYNWQINYDESI